MEEERIVKMPELNDLQLDALREINHIGVQNSASALSSMLGKRVDIPFSHMDVMPLVDIPDMIAAGGETKAVFLGLEGKLLGSVVFVFEKENALKLVSTITGEQQGTEFSELGLSAFLETGNILAGSYMSAMANFFSERFMPTTPRIISDIQTELVPFVLEASKQQTDTVLMMSSEIEIKNDNIKGVCIVILTSSAIEVLMGELETKLAGDRIGGNDMARFELDDIEKDTLAEIGNVGTNAAATALSQMIGQSIVLNVPRATICDIREITGMLGGPEAPVVAFFMNVEGSISSDTLLLFSKDSALLLSDLSQGKAPGTTVEMDEMDVSAVSEIAQIMCGAYMSVVSKFINLELVHGNPHYTEDMAASVMDFAITRMAEKYENALVIDAAVESDDKSTNFRSVFLLLLPPKSLKQMLQEAKKVLGA